MKDSSDPKDNQRNVAESLRRSFPPFAIAGAWASFASAVSGAQSKAPASRNHSPGSIQTGLSDVKSGAGLSQPHLELEYKVSADFAAPKFSRSLAGVAIARGDRIAALGDDEIRIFEPTGAKFGSWKAPSGATCLSIDHDGSVLVGTADRVEIYGSTGKHEHGFAVGNSGKPVNITALKIFNKEILVADAAGRCIHRHSFDGKKLGEIGTQNKTRGFILPNRFLDIDVDATGNVFATDSGRHRVSAWTIQGTLTGSFGKFGLRDPRDFVGCCNPVNLSVMPDGKIVTAEKVIARLKIYDAAGKLLALIGPEHFDPKCTHLHLAVDSKSRIVVADPVRLEIKLFTAAVKPGGRESI